MSSITFRSPSGAVQLRGSERAYMGNFIYDLAGGFIASDIRYGGPIRQRYVDLIPDGHYLKKDGEFHVAWQGFYLTAWRVGFGDSIVEWKGQPFSTFSFALNTALAVGNEQVKLLARIHAQCEIHGYFLGKDRAEVADIIDSGLSSGLYRQGMGWAELAEFLRSDEEDPVVMSYSETDGFPDSEIGDWMPWPDGLPRDWNALSEEQSREREEKSDAFYDLPDEQQWAISYAGLENDEGLTPINRDSLGETFGHNLSIFDLVADDWEARFDAVLETCSSGAIGDND